MLLFYSDHCNHCCMLKETLKTHDPDKRVKMVSVDYIRQQNMVLDNRINQVPAMFFKDTNKIIFGKEVFDYLLLPGHGVLLTSKQDPTKQSSVSNASNSNIDDEPSGMFSFIGQSYETLQENDNSIMGPVTVWEELEGEITGNQNQIIDQKPISNDDTEKSHKSLPSLAEIQKNRELDLQ